MKQRVILIASVICGLIAALLTRQYLNARDREVDLRKRQLEDRYRTISVIGVNHAIPAGTVLAASDLCAMRVVEGAVRGHVVDESQYIHVLRRKLLRSLEAGAPIYWSDIDGGDPLNHGLADEITDRMRAISISVGGPSAVSGMVKPGDHVDVIGTFTLPSPTKPNELEMVTQTIMQNVLILATGRETAKTQLQTPDRGGGGGGYSTVTVLVTPREVEMLVFAEQTRGRLVLALRNPNDVDREMDLPRVDFAKIQEEIDKLNALRQSFMRTLR